MSDAIDETEAYLSADFRTPEMEMAELGAGVPAAADLALAAINPANPHLFREDRWQEHFARLRAEDPVHLNELETSGRYWSVTTYDDVRAVDGDWETFSSARGITLGLRPSPEVDAQLQRLTSFISMDPPTHTDQRKTVRPLRVAPAAAAASCRRVGSPAAARSPPLVPRSRCPLGRPAAPSAARSGAGAPRSAPGPPRRPGTCRRWPTSATCCY